MSYREDREENEKRKEKREDKVRMRKRGGDDEMFGYSVHVVTEVFCEYDIEL